MPFRPKNTRFWHYDFQVGGRRFHGSCGTEDFETAKAVEAEARVRAKSAPAARGIYTISEAIGTYWSDICQHQSSARTALSQGKAVVDGMGARTNLTDLTDAAVMRFVARQRATLSAATINRRLDLLNRAMRHMARVHKAALPDIDLKSYRQPEAQERVRELTAAEQDALFTQLRADMLPLVKLALLTGQRLAELCGLKWSDVDLDAGLVLFRVKGGKTRRLPVSRELRAFLSALPRADQLPDRHYVLTYESQRHKDRRRIRFTPSGGGLMADFRAALAKAGIDDFRFHDLRHTFASRMLRQTGNLKLVSRLLGHSTIETTTRYAHVMDDDLRDALDAHPVLTVSRRNPRSRRKST